MLSFHEWERSIEPATTKPQEIQDGKEPAGAKAENQVEEKFLQSNETVNKIRKLCRVCSSNGLISITSNIANNLLKIKPSGDIRNWQIPISKIIADISGENVSSDDSLPQFICEHCLGYLQHAYELRLKIIANSANLRIVSQIANEDSVQLEDTHIDQSRITKREIDEWNEETNEASHFYSQFSGANIKINQSATKQERAIEHKCPSCKKRVMSIKSLNEHMELCAISVLDALFSQFKSIYSLRISTRLTTYEFILKAIRLVFDTQKKLQKVVNAENIDVASITSEIPIEDVSTYYQFPQQQPLKFNFKRRDYQSPDNDVGYISGGNCNYTHQ